MSETGIAGEIMNYEFWVLDCGIIMPFKGHSQFREDLSGSFSMLLA